jgi:hypothetical protein
MSKSSEHNLQLVSKVVGPLPLLDGFLERLQVERFLGKFVPAGDRRQRQAPAVGLGVLLRNIMLARRPLYGLAEWAQRYDSALLGLSTDAPEYFNDDRVGRCLDALFLAEGDCAGNPFNSMNSARSVCPCLRAPRRRCAAGEAVFTSP